MVNTLTIKRDAHGAPISIQVVGKTTNRDNVSHPVDFHKANLSDYMDGVATLSFIFGEEQDSFTWTLQTDPNDPNDKPGQIAYDVLSGLVSHTFHELNDPVSLTPFEVEFNALKNTVNLLLARKNTIYDTLSLDITTDAKGVIIHHEFKCEKADRSEAIWCPNPHVIGLIQKPNELPCALLRWFDTKGGLEAEARCRVGTNELLGFRKLIANSRGTTRSYTAPQAETFLHESEAGE